MSLLVVRFALVIRRRNSTFCYSSLGNGNLKRERSFAQERNSPLDEDTNCLCNVYWVRDLDGQGERGLVTSVQRRPGSRSAIAAVGRRLMC
jgi:hypothetical protein